jgi:hypothetical protein
MQVWIVGIYLGTGSFNACGNGSFGVGTTTPAATLDVVGTGKYSGTLTCGNLTCGSIGTQGNSISSGTIACTGANPGSTATYDLGTTSVLWRHAYYTGNHYNSGTAGFTASSTAAFTPAAPFHFLGSSDANGNSAILGVNNIGTGLILDDIALAKWRITTAGYSMNFQQHNSAIATKYANTAFTTRVTFTSNGDITATRNIYAGSTVYANNVALTSDQRLKTNVRPIKGALAKLCTLDGKTFDFKPLNGTTVRPNMSGFIAQEMQTVFPKWIAEWDDGNESFPGEEPLLGIDAGYGLQAYLVEAIKELRDEIRHSRRD